MKTEAPQVKDKVYTWTWTRTVLSNEEAHAALLAGEVIYRVSDPGRIIWSEIVNTPFGRRRVYFYFDADKCDGAPGTLEWIGKCNHLYEVYDPSDNIYFNPEEEE